MTLFDTLYLTHWEAWGDLFSTLKHKYSLPSGGKCVFFVNSTGKRGKSDQWCQTRGCTCGLNTDIMFLGCYTGVEIICIWYFTLFWMEVLYLCWTWWGIKVGVKLVVYYVWFSVDDNNGFLSVGIDDLGRLYLKERPISLPMVPMSTINTKYSK